MATAMGSWESFGFAGVASAPQASNDHLVGAQPAVQKSLGFEDPEGVEALPANMLDAPFDVLWARGIAEVMLYLHDHQFKEAACILARAHELNKHSRKIEQDAEQADTPFHEFLRLQVHHEQRSLLAQFYALRKAAVDVSGHTVFKSGSVSSPPASNLPGTANHSAKIVETDVSCVSTNVPLWQDQFSNIDSDNTLVSFPPHDGPSEKKKIEYLVENNYAPRMAPPSATAPLKVATAPVPTDNFTIGGSQLGFLNGDDGLDILEQMQHQILQLHQQQQESQQQNHGIRAGMPPLGPVYEQRAWSEPWSEPWDVPHGRSSLKGPATALCETGSQGAHSDAACWERTAAEHHARNGPAVQESQAVAVQESAPWMKAPPPKAQSLTLSTSLQLLGKEDPDTVFIVRRIHKIGFKAGKRLAMYFSRFGEVRRVLIARSNRKDGVAEDHPQWRRRPSSLGFVQMVSSTVVAQVLALGNEQEVGGFPILIERFEKASGESELQPAPEEYQEELSYM